MVPLLEQHQDAIRAACRRHGVAKLAVFGSATDPKSFDPERSDIDFIVSFHQGKDLGPWLAEYFDLGADLENALGSPVDLVMERAARDLVFSPGSEPAPTLVFSQIIG